MHSHSEEDDALDGEHFFVSLLFCSIGDDDAGDAVLDFQGPLRGEDRRVEPEAKHGTGSFDLMRLRFVLTVSRTTSPAFRLP